MSGGGSKEQTVGFNYYMGLHMGICAGPVDSVKAIKVGDRLAWTGNATASTSTYIVAPELFGGDEREGGIYGPLAIMHGESSQQPDAYLTAQQGSPQPAYRGILSLIFKGGLVSANNPYLKPWAVRVKRIVKGWTSAVPNASKAEITLDNGVAGMNPAHIIYECLTNTEWGMGYSPSALDEAAFTAAGNTLHSEGFGLCLQWTRQDTIENFVQIILDHIGATLTVDPSTGMYKLRLIREDYNPTTLPILSPDNVLELQQYQRAGVAELTNEITINYTDGVTGKDAAITVQDMASIQAQGGIVHAGKNYPGIANYSLAAKVAMRDLKIVSTALCRVRLTANRTASGIEPGDVVRFTWPKLGITEVVLRVVRVNYGTLTEGRVTIEATEDVYGLPQSSYAAQQATGWIEPVTAPQAATIAASFEAPYRELVRYLDPSQLAALSSTASFAAAAAARPTGTSTGFNLYDKGSSASTYRNADAGAFSPGGTLTTAIGPTDTTLTLSSATDLSQIAVGQAAIINGAEIVRVDAINTTLNTLTVGRGCADTVPQSHAAGVSVLVYDTTFAYDTTEFATGEIVNTKLLTKSTGGTLTEANAPTVNITMSGRQARPYPPAQLRVNGTYYPTSINEAISLTWVPRNRITQADKLTDYTAASVTAEANTTYNVRVRSAGTTRRTYTGLTTTSQEYTFGQEIADGGPFNPVTLQVESSRNGTTSLQAANHTVARDLDRIMPLRGSADATYVTATSVSHAYPTGIRAGDLVLAFVMHRSALTAVGAEWTLVTSIDNPDSAGAFTQTLSVYRRSGTAGLSGSATFTQTTSARMALFLLPFTSGNGVGSVTVESFTSSQGDTGVITVPTLTAAGNNRVAVVAASAVELSGSAFLVPTDYTQATSGFLVDNRMAVGYRRRNNGETTGGTYTVTTTQWNQVVLMLTRV